MCNQFEMVALNLALQFEMVALNLALQFEMVALNLALQFVHKISDFGTGCTSSGPTVRVPGELPGMRTGKEEYVQPVRSQNL